MRRALGARDVTVVGRVLARVVAGLTRMSKEGSMVIVGEDPTKAHVQVAAVTGAARGIGHGLPLCSLSAGMQ